VKCVSARRAPATQSVPAPRRPSTRIPNPIPPRGLSASPTASPPQRAHKARLARRLPRGLVRALRACLTFPRSALRQSGTARHLYLEDTDGCNELAWPLGAMRLSELGCVLRCGLQPEARSAHFGRRHAVHCGGQNAPRPAPAAPKVKETSVTALPNCTQTVTTESRGNRPDSCRCSPVAIGGPAACATPLPLATAYRPSPLQRIAGVVPTRPRVTDAATCEGLQAVARTPVPNHDEQVALSAATRAALNTRTLRGFPEALVLTVPFAAELCIAAAPSSHSASFSRQLPGTSPMMHGVSRRQDHLERPGAGSRTGRCSS